MSSMSSMSRVGIAHQSMLKLLHHKQPNTQFKCTTAYECSWQLVLARSLEL